MTASARRFAPSPDQPLLPIGDFAPTDLAARRRVPVRAHLRTVGGVTPPSGAERKEAALDALAAKEVTQRMVAYVRSELRTIYARRLALLGDSACVTADDIDVVLRCWPECPAEAQPAHGPQHWRGTVFRGKGWRLTNRTVRSVRPHMNSTSLPCWIATDTEAP